MKFVDSLGDREFVMMRRDWPMVISATDERAWARFDEWDEARKRFDCRVLGTNKRNLRAWMPRLYERMHGGDPLMFRETMLRQNGRGSLLNSIMFDHDRPMKF